MQSKTGGTDMIKRTAAAMLCAPLALAGVCGAEAAEAECKSYINAVQGVAVSTPVSEYIPGRYINVAFDAKNTTGSAVDVNILVEISNSDSERTASAVFERTIKPGESMPVRLSSTISVPSDGAYVNINAEGPARATDIYVSPRGNNRADGSFQNPLKTVSAALERAKEWDGSGEYDGKDVSVIFRGGRYDISEAQEMTGFKNISSLTLKSDGSDVVFSGGVTLSGKMFEKVSDEKELSMFPENVHGKLYKIKLLSYGISTDYSGNNVGDDPIYTMLYYNGKQGQIAKYPNEGYAVADTMWTDGKLSIKSDSIKDWSDYKEAWVRGFFIYEWDLARGHVSAVADGALSLGEYLCGSKPDTLKNEENKNWYIYNLPAELDSEGEYVIKNNILYYYPPESDVADGSFENMRIQLSTNRDDLLTITDAGKISIEDISFENSGGYFINAKTDNLRIAGCKFENASASAVYVFGNNNTVTSCDFRNLGGMGINIGGGDVNTLEKSGSVLKNCMFEKTSQIYRTNQAAFVLSGCGVTASRNTVTGTPHLAVSYSGNDHIIEYNDIYGCLTDNANDAGIIYTGNNLANLGTVIRRNYIHDSNSGIGAVYWDDWLSGQTAEKNIFENIDSVLLIHGGVCNTFSGNLVKNARYGAKIRGKGLYITVDEVKYNVWDEINGRYNGHANLFMGNLVGVPESNGYYPGVAWKSYAWQSAYGNVLKYVNNKTAETAEETTVMDNCFVDTATGVYTYAETTDSDLNMSGNTTELTAQQTAEFENIKANCGIYADMYRKM